jgi:hypothetical protein
LIVEKKIKEFLLMSMAVIGKKKVKTMGPVLLYSIPFLLLALVYVGWLFNNLWCIRFCYFVYQNLILFKVVLMCFIVFLNVEISYCSNADEKMILYDGEHIAASVAESKLTQHHHLLSHAKEKSLILKDKFLGSRLILKARESEVSAGLDPTSRGPIESLPINDLKTQVNSYSEEFKEAEKTVDKLSSVCEQLKRSLTFLSRYDMFLEEYEAMIERDGAEDPVWLKTDDDYMTFKAKAESCGKLQEITKRALLKYSERSKIRFGLY